jgi:hypothetical protein
MAGLSCEPVFASLLSLLVRFKAALSFFYGPRTC